LTRDRNTLDVSCSFSGGLDDKKKEQRRVVCHITVARHVLYKAEPRTSHPRSRSGGQ
jgi:hypothetical protein